MHVGLGMLKLPPRAFWSMTPRELHAAVSLADPEKPLSRSRLAHLMSAFPDQTQPAPF